MSTKGWYALTARDQSGVSLYSKLILVSIIIALMFAYVPAASVLAAPARDGDPSDFGNLKDEWKTKLRNLRVLGTFYERVRLQPADFEDPDDLARVHYFLEKYGVALRQANTVVFNHTGFDINGNVLNERQAVDTLHELGMYLHMMRGFRGKMEAVQG